MLMHSCFPYSSILTVCSWSHKRPLPIAKMAAAGERLQWQEQLRPLWKWSICTPGCAFGNDFSWCDNTANTAAWSNHATNQGLCKHFVVIIIVLSDDQSCNLWWDNSKSVLVQLSHRFKGNSANWKPKLEWHTTIMYGSHVQDMKMTHPNGPQPDLSWTYGHVVYICRLWMICSNLNHLNPPV